MKTWKILCIFLVAVFIFSIPVLTGCGTTKWAEPIAENVLVSLNNQDYAGFAKDFDSSLVVELPEESFPQILASTTGVWGKYIDGSKKMNSINISNGITTVVYTCQFENNNAVSYTLTFQKVGDIQKIIGIQLQ